MKIRTCRPKRKVSRKRRPCRLRVTNPSQCQRLSSLQQIEGVTCPCEVVSIRIDNNPVLKTIADECGAFRIVNPYSLADGDHTIYVRNCCCCICRKFTIGESSFLIQPIEARMGSSFRTVDVEVLVSGACGLATVYYLLLPPGSPTPSVSEIMNYANTEALLDGTSATGQFTTLITSGQTNYTWALTGLDNPDAPSGTTGVIDGYRYDVYLYVVLCMNGSGVLAFDGAAMGMPFSSGLGTADNPFTIRELTPEELQMYPDLLEGNSLNVPGVDENARMLENIERLVTLYEATNGLYGLEDSMALNYLMTTDIDLSGYAAAYDGEGWESIGDIDGWINDRKETEHLFSGVFSGGGHTITNLSITPTATDDYFVGYRGLFGGVEEGTIKDLTLSGVLINAFATAPGQAQFGSFIAISRNPVLEGLTLENANITADIGEILVGDTHAINIGGFVAEIFEGGTIRNISGSNINIIVPERSALALGGFVGFTDKFDAYESYENIQLSNLNISGHAMIGGLAGYVVYGVNLIENATINQITITSPGGESGGLIGRLYIYSGTGDCLIENCTVQNITVLLRGTGDPGGNVGGLIGNIEENPFTLLSQPAMQVFGVTTAPAVAQLAVWPMTIIQRCSVTQRQINCNFNGGGLIGHVNIDRTEAALRTFVNLCKTDISVAAATTNAGGLIGFCQSVIISQCFARGNVSAAANLSGGLIGHAIDSNITDCYSLGDSSGGSIAGGETGILDNTELSRCYSVGNVSASDFAGGISGSANSSTINSNLVLGGTITAATAHRILGVNSIGSVLQNNYALNTVVPMPGISDPNGLDGGTITSSQIIVTMQNLGWNIATIWNTATVATLNRPTLLQNPE